VFYQEPAMAVLPRLATFTRKRGQTLQEVGSVPETLQPLLHEAKLRIPFYLYRGVPVYIRYTTGASAKPLC